jgi:hypothetical protein
MANSDGMSILRTYCLRIVEFISSVATDPHLYFQYKLTADIAAAANLTDLMSLLNGLINWVDSADLKTGQIKMLDENLSAEELPSFSLIRSPRAGKFRQMFVTGQVGTEQECCLISTSFLKAEEISEVDRIFIERLLKAYESRG